MLLLDIIKSLEYYLKRSPKDAENFVDFLDDLTVDTKTKDSLKEIGEWDRDMYFYFYKLLCSVLFAVKLSLSSN